MSEHSDDKGNFTARQPTTPYFYTPWVRFTESMNTDVRALSDRDFGTALNEMMAEEEIDPNLPPDVLTNYVVAKSIAVTIGQHIRRETLREICSFALWTEDTWQKVDQHAITAFRKAIAREDIGTDRFPGKTRAKAMDMVCKNAVEEYDNYSTIHRTALPSKSPEQSNDTANTDTVAERLQRHGLPPNLLVTYQKCPDTNVVSPELLKKSTDIDEVQDKAVVDASLSVETSTETPEVSNSSPLFVYSPPSKTSPSVSSPVSTPVSTSVLSPVSPSVSPSVSPHFEPSRLKLSGLPSPSKLFPFPPTPISQASFLAHDTYLQRPQPEPPPLPPELRCRRLAFYPLHRLDISPRVLR
ncbi:MAG: hypothetical protein SEPTF4163_002362 [Sporothrix epigloea]